MRYALPWLVSLACTWAAEAEPPRPAIPNPTAPSTNDVRFSLDLSAYRTMPLSLDPLIRYQQELTPSSLTFQDRFGPPSRLGWVHRLEARGYSINDDIASAGENGAADTFVNALRETSVAILPLDQWEEIPRDLVEGSLGNTPEEHVDPISPTYDATEVGWWRRMREDGFIQYGFRPFRTNPYIYASMVWRDRDRNPILFAHIRCYYRIMRSEKIEGQISIPISRTWTFSAGGQFVPSKLDGDPSNRSLSFRLERSVCPSSPFHGFVYVGGRVDGRQGGVEGGFSTPL